MKEWRVGAPRAIAAPPVLLDDICRYVRDGRVQAASINPYRLAAFMLYGTRLGDTPADMSRLNASIYLPPSVLLVVS